MSVLSEHVQGHVRNLNIESYQPPSSTRGGGGRGRGQRIS